MEFFTFVSLFCLLLVDKCLVFTELVLFKGELFSFYYTYISVGNTERLLWFKRS